MKVTIIGAGAIGCAVGYRLAEGGHEVALVDVWVEHVVTIVEHGLTVVEPGGARTVRVPATTQVAAAAGAEVVLVAVKAFANDDVAGALRGVLDPGAIVVTVQNGIGNAARLAAVLDPGRVVQGSTVIGGEVRGPGRVWIAPGTVRGESRTVLGRPADPAPAAVTERFAEALNGAGLPTEVVDDVDRLVWRKAVFAAAIGPLCATIDGTIIDVLDRPPAAAVLKAAFAEMVAVARADGVALDPGQMWDQAVANYRSIGPHPPSLAVDVAHGRRTEVEAQLGEICRRGAAARIATPVCDTLAALVRSREPAGAGG